MTASGRKKRSEIKPEFIIKVPPQPAPGKISDAQQVQLDIIERTNFNSFDGQKISRLLKENRDLWRAVLMPLDLISLRDMPDGTWHADTLYIFVDDGCQFKLEELVREQFEADEIQWIGGSEAEDILGTTELEDRSSVILLIWWD
jgi:hypothetical protein